MQIPRAYQKFIRQIKDVRLELKKVHWPNRKEMYLYTTIVFTAIVVIGVFFWVLDTGFTALLRVLLQQ
ncbi:MAG TPA: preprotein translocase subunit SecE [Firmicutes bacterium]|nr:preprotein translocase subunit SecE [Bacillota bacterium]